ncbi:LAQU0S09e02432g1_1 [Lachancea quebecensis]|uniref:Mediator of RNA polymerase II transcription subunit 9 n=1 Tax=Lachancea quebecensis TaxID=1654605 RepID=A0A0P1KSY6_9SACH|nr:LAQU0S09e02432g1_1 [Lachancea quebecensis]
MASPGLSNASLAQIEALLVPNAQNSSQSSEFIPQLYYALHQVKKDPNSSANSLETATSSIRHRLKQCKSHIAESEECRALLSKTPEEWESALQQRQKDLALKQQVFARLEQQVRDLQGQ